MSLQNSVLPSTNDDVFTFLRSMAVVTRASNERWIAIIWWHNRHNCTSPTLKQICDDMETSGYGRPRPARVKAVLSRDRRIARNGQGMYSIKITALADVDKSFSPVLTESRIEKDATTPAKLAPFETPATGSSRGSINKSSKPSIFIGSSSEGLRYARALEKQLVDHVEVTIWKDGVFGLGAGTLETLVADLPRYDFAALILTPDDLTECRNNCVPSPRDNVIFELGLFMGRLGRFRTFIIYNKDLAIKLPTDLAGVTSATFGERIDGNYHAQISPPSTLIIDAIEKWGKVKA